MRLDRSLYYSKHFSYREGVPFLFYQRSISIVLRRAKDSAPPPPNHRIDAATIAMTKYVLVLLATIAFASWVLSPSQARDAELVEHSEESCLKKRAATEPMTATEHIDVPDRNHARKLLQLFTIIISLLAVSVRHAWTTTPATYHKAGAYASKPQTPARVEQRKFSKWKLGPPRTSSGEIEMF